MGTKKSIRWQDMNHSHEPLLEYLIGRNSSQTKGPIPEFLAKKAAEREPATYIWYRYSLMQLWNFLEELDFTTIKDFNEHSVNLFRVHMRERELKENTISNRLRAIRAFAGWMGERGWTDGNVLQGLKVPQSTKPTFDLIDDNKRLKLFQLYSYDTYLGSRNLAMLAVLSDTGLRREELVNLKLKNIDFEGKVLKVYSDKTEEWRYLPLTDEVMALLRNHLKWRDRYFARSSRPRLTKRDDGLREHKSRSIQSDCIFLTWDGRAIAPSSFGEILFRASKKLGFRVHPHLFRHDWITRKAMDGENPSIVKRWAGHKSYVMTDYYFGLAEDMLGAIRPKKSVLSSMPLPGIRRKERQPRAAVK